jgi:hypothetical protein
MVRVFAARVGRDLKDSVQRIGFLMEGISVA